MNPPLVVRGSRLSGALLIATGGIAIGTNPSSVVSLVSGGALVAFGLLTFAQRLVVVTPTEVQVRNLFFMVMKRIEIEGLGDLQLDGDRLRDARDRKSIANLSRWMAVPDDVKSLRAVLECTPSS